MNRRRFLYTAVLPALLPTRTLFAATGKDATVAEIQGRWREFVAPTAEVAADTRPLARAAEEWRRELPADSYAVLFDEDTEPPLSSPLNLEHRPGVFVCRACRLPLFTSEMKYESGTGWPSFFTSIPDHLATKADYKLTLPRTEYHCVRCGGHQGHVFDDGPPPTGERWCNNGVALTFIPLQAVR
ncbi:MAG: peptide-methionine (R)-S-oxide reductase MsrB [Gammaproteobacteria bacterium]